MDTANHTQLQIPKKGAVFCNGEMAAILMVLICLDDTVPPTDNALSQILTILQCQQYVNVCKTRIICANIFFC